MGWDRSLGGGAGSGGLGEPGGLLVSVAVRGRREASYFLVAGVGSREACFCFLGM